MHALQPDVGEPGPPRRTAASQELLRTAPVQVKVREWAWLAPLLTARIDVAALAALKGVLVVPPAMPMVAGSAMAPVPVKVPTPVRLMATADMSDDPLHPPRSLERSSSPISDSVIVS